MKYNKITILLCFILSFFFFFGEHSDKNEGKKKPIRNRKITRKKKSRAKRKRDKSRMIKSKLKNKENPWENLKRLRGK